MADPTASDHEFVGSVPELYERLLVPLIFEAHADDLVHRVAARHPTRVLEVAAGTGVVTRRLAAELPDTVEIVATDLNAPMLDHAAAIGTQREVTWQPADVYELPFDDDSFDVVACQFGVMFFPDKAAAYREVGRVLRPGGAFVFNVWDDIGNNEFADEVTKAMAGLWPDDPPRFLPRTPHGYWDEATIRTDVAAGGFGGAVDYTTVDARARAASPDIPATAYCQGTPLRGEIEQRDPEGLVAATRVAAAAVQARFGSENLDSLVRGFVVEAVAG